MELISIIKITIVVIVIVLNIFILYAFHLATKYYADYYKYMCIIGTTLMIINMIILFFILRFNQHKQSQPKLSIIQNNAYDFYPHEIVSQNYTIL